MDSINPDSYLYYKLKDIRKVYEGFEDYLSEKYITKEEMLDVLSDAVPRSNILKGSVVAMDGFTGFNAGSGPAAGRTSEGVRQGHDHCGDG